MGRKHIRERMGQIHYTEKEKGLDRECYDEAYLLHRFSEVMGSSGTTPFWLGDADLIDKLKKNHLEYVDGVIKAYSEFQKNVMSKFRNPGCEIKLEITVRKYRKQNLFD